MIRRFSVDTGDRRGPIDVEASAPASTPLKEILDALRVSDDPWFAGTRSLDPNGPFEQVRNGNVLRQQPARSLPPSLTEVRVLAGPSTGLRAVVDDQGISIGRGEECDVCINDASVSRHHASIRIRGGHVEMADNNSTNGTRVNGERLDPGSVRLIDPEDVIEVGDSVLRVARTPSANGEVIRAEDGRLQFNVQPRNRTSYSPVSLDLPQPPQQSDDFSSNIALGSSLTMAAGTVVMSVMTRPQFLFLALLAPLQFVVVNRIQKRRRQFSFKKEIDKHQSIRSRRLDELSLADSQEARALRESFPSVDEVVDMCEGPTSRLWERLPEDDDFASFRIGSYDRISSSRIKMGDADPVGSKLAKMPITVSLRQLPVVGLVGHRPSALGLARWILLQLCALHSPARLRMIVLCPEKGEPDWGWTKWVPHVWNGDTANVSTDAVSTQALLDGLAEAIDDSLQDITFRGADLPPPQTLLVVDGMTRLAGNPSLDKILTDGPLAGVTVLCIESSRERLRSETSGVITVNEDCTVEASWMPPSRERQVTELIDRSSVEKAVRAIAHLEPMSAGKAAAGLPFPLFFDDVLPDEHFDRNGIADKWNGTSPRTTFAFGSGESGPLTLDLVADGPHFLVVGTSGAGKSEAIQSMIASLASSNRPDQLNFALIDFKGGACYGAAMDLPHSTAKVVNLQGTDGVNRALASIDAELTWRQERFAEVEPRASSLDEYNSRRSPNQAEIPRLVIVIDEYAVFVNEAKGATDRVTKIARIGRSLGMHLIIGTQSPRGVIDNAIKANVQTKICLRTGDSTESALVVDSPLPSRIPGHLRGRGYALTPNGRLTVFQTAWVGAPLQSSSPEVQVRYLEFDHLVFPASSSGDVTTGGESSQKRFDVLAADIAAVWSRRPESKSALRSPILPSLDLRIPLSAVLSSDDHVRIGIQDRILRQDQPVVRLDPLDGRHVLVLGSSGSGRTSALRTIAVAAGHCNRPIHVYCIDLGSRRLASLEDLPHVGAVITESDAQKTSDLLAQIGAELRRRDDLLGLRRANRINELDEQLPAILLLIDNWPSFSRLIESDRSLSGQFNEILTKGGSTGLKVIAAGDHEFDLSLSRSFAEKFLLFFNDQTPYLRYGVEPAQIPTEMIPGRALHMSSGDFVQFAEVSNTDFVHVPRPPGDVKPMALKGLPENVSLSSLKHESRDGSPFTVVLGVAGPQVETVTVNLDQEGAILITGRPKSGRTTLVEAIAVQLRSRGVKLAFMGGRRSPLRARSDMWSWSLEPNSPENSTLLDEIAQDELPVALLLDDVRAEIVDDSLFAKFTANMRNRTLVVNTLWSEARMINARSPIGQALKDSCIATVLMPEPDTQLRDLLVVIPRSLHLPDIPGRGLLFRDGSAVTIQTLTP